MAGPNSDKKEIVRFIPKDPKKSGSNKGIFQKKAETEGRTMEVNVVRCVARESLRKCEDPEARNSERIFVKGDEVEVICASRKDFEEGKDVDVWLIATKHRKGGTKRSPWRRPLERLREVLKVTGEDQVSVAIEAHGWVRGKRGFSDSITCSSVVVGGHSFWIEDGAFPINGPETQGTEGKEMKEGVRMDGNELPQQAQLSSPLPSPSSSSLALPTTSLSPTHQITTTTVTPIFQWRDDEEAEGNAPRDFELDYFDFYGDYDNTFLW